MALRWRARWPRISQAIRRRPWRSRAP